MKKKIDNYTVIDNAKANQYEFHIGEFIPKVEYIKRGSTIFLSHTEVPVELEGKGIGFSLVKRALIDISLNDLTLVPLCPFVALYIKRNPEWKKLVIKSKGIENKLGIR